MNEFYVYVLFDWRGIPRYIGKGKGKRWLSHERQTDPKNFLKNEFIEETWNILGEIPKTIIREDLPEREAYSIEQNLIKALGRISLQTGPLTNLTAGGDGYIDAHTPAQRSASAKLREQNIGPEGRRRRALMREANLTFEERSQRSKRGLSKLSKEQLQARAILGASRISKEAKRERAIKAAQSRTSEQRKKSARLGASRIPQDKLRERALKAASKMPSGWHEAAMAKARSALDMSEEAKSERAKRAQLSRSPEERSAIVRKAWATRKARNV